MQKTLYLTTFLAGLAASSLAMAAPVVTSLPAGGGTLDYANAKPMPLPLTSVAPAGIVSAVTTGAPTTLSPGFDKGGAGSGALTPAFTPVPKALSTTPGFSSQQFGTANHPFTTARAAAKRDSTSGEFTTDRWPYRATGKLFFSNSGSTYVCSASLIKRGVLVTAAHCVANFGHNQVYSNWKFHPGYRSGVSPFGIWTAKSVHLMTAYLNGTDPCASGANGVVCKDDVAVIVLNATAAGAYPGTQTGWYGSAWNGYGFTGGTTGTALGMITQLGYPQAIDNGTLMERTDSQSYRDSTLANNNVIGSMQTGGSSGGPWLVNFGIAPVITNSGDASFGSETQSNTVVGTTSWGYSPSAGTPSAVKEQGASPFLSTNFVVLRNAACTATPAACQ